MPRLPLVLACCAVAASIGTPAHAAGGTVEGHYETFLNPFGSDYLVVAECNARAIPGTEVDVALATSVACYVKDPDGSQPAATNVTPGPFTSTVFQGIARPSMFLCISASATFFQSQPPGTYTVNFPERCDGIGP